MPPDPQLGLGPGEGRRPGEPLRLTDFRDAGDGLREQRDRLKLQTEVSFDLEVFVEWMALSRLTDVGLLSLVDLNDGLDHLNRQWRLGIEAEELARIAQRVWDKLNAAAAKQNGDSQPPS
jgi:hypothetical protein